MNSLMFMLFCIFISIAFAFNPNVKPGDKTTPSGKIRPTVPVIYITTAGKFPVQEKPLTSFKTTYVCLKDYPTGFSLRCETTTGPDFPTVVFRVAGQVYHKEFKPPYFISRNTAENIVKPFPFTSFKPNQKIMKKRLRVACRVRTRQPVWVDLVDECLK